MNDDVQSRVIKIAQHVDIFVCRPVIHGNNFKVVVAFLIHNPLQALGQIAPVVVTGDHEGNLRCYLRSSHQLFSQSMLVCLITRAGTPTAVTPSGKSWTTTAPAP